MVGCTKHENFIGNTTSVIPSTTSNSTPTPTTSNSTLTPTTLKPTTTSPSYAGKVVPAQPGEGPADIWVDKYSCYPNVLTVEIGTKVTWTNYDIVFFTIVGKDGLFLGSMEPNGGQWSYTFEDAGFFGYSIDPYNDTVMGEVIVLG